ncbi:MAG: DUF3277 family protein [Deltaproteobacteria bacterium]|nr:DUF3277 family protein [Deltaproteobacteria bacterium]
MTLHKYDPKDVKVTFGPALIMGFGPDTFVSIEYSNDAFAMAVGADGEVVRSKSNDQSAVVTLTLMAGSSGNAVLSAALNADVAEGLGVFPLAIVDLSTGTTHFGKEAWVVKDPKTDYAKESQPKEWRLAVAKMQSGHGVAL